MAITEFFAGVAVADFRAMRAWYERLFGRPPDFFPHDAEAAWRVAEHAWVYAVAVERSVAECPGGGLLTILVDDLEDQVARLTERGVPLGPIDVLPGAARKAEISDPEGNKITFGQPLVSLGWRAENGSVGEDG
jgi:catechol 2,3-dioxygenase-like lactoylglutathione lyase family enzyme